MKTTINILTTTLLLLLFQLAHSQTVAYVKGKTLYVSDPSFSSGRIKIDDISGNYQVGDHAVAYDIKSKLYIASSASKWKSRKIEDRVSSYQLSHGTLIFTKSGNLYRLDSFKPGSKYKRIAKDVRSFQVYDDD